MLLFNTLTQKKEEFKTFKPNTITMYVCGITPYDTTHLGHAFTYIFFDTLQRYLKYLGNEIIYTQNVTDINDRDNDILIRAKEQNISWQELGEYWTKHFLDDMQKLNWIMPKNYYKASEHLPTMITLIEKLLKNGLAYQVNGSVYLDISKKNDFGKLSRLTAEKMVEQAREFEEDLDNPDKHHPLDITLWRFAKPDEPKHIPSFDSPYGKGRPGWHIECSAMAICSLGEQIDIHGGGKDLIYPHHESEIAQSEGATGKIPFAKFWIHTAYVQCKGEKMSKSKGNLVMVSDLLKKYKPEVIRFVLLSHHYRMDWNFDESELDEAQKKLDIIKNALNKESQLNGLITDDSYSKQFMEALDDDMNTLLALKVTNQLAADILENKSHGNSGMIQNTLQLFLQILGLKLS